MKAYKPFKFQHNFKTLELHQCNLVSNFYLTKSATLSQNQGLKQFANQCLLDDSSTKYKLLCIIIKSYYWRPLNNGKDKCQLNTTKHDSWTKYQLLAIILQ